MNAASGHYCFVNDRGGGCALRAGYIFKRILLAIAAVLLCGQAMAVEALTLPPDTPTIDLRGAIERYFNQGERIQVSTAPGADGIVRRIEVRSENPEGTSDWIVFALANPSDEQIDRLLVAPHYRLVGSGLIWPDLGSERIRAVTPSEGFAPVRLPGNEDDVFRITLDPGAVVTYWRACAPGAGTAALLAKAFEDMVTLHALSRVVLGIAGLLALFLSVLFVVKGTAMFPATAALAWAVLAYISIDFDFWSRLFQTAGGNVNTWRAGTEVVLAGALVIFLYTYLHLHRWHVRYSQWPFFGCSPRSARRVHRRRPERRRRRGADLARGHRGGRACRHPLSFAARIRPGDHADPDLLVPSSGSRPLFSPSPAASTTRSCSRRSPAASCWSSC